MLAMTWFTRHSLTGPGPLEDAHPWPQCRCIMDVGGGQGALLSRCMQAAGDQCQGILFDRPMVLDRCVSVTCRLALHAPTVCHAPCGCCWHWKLDAMFLDSVDVESTFVKQGVDAKRVQLVAGDVRDALPAVVQDAAPDTIVMKHFLSAFSDADVACILGNCKRVLAPRGTILLLQVLQCHTP